jgi:hypothetical protein
VAGASFAEVVTIRTHLTDMDFVALRRPLAARVVGCG